ncbi:hypothetical protein G6F63_015853 [Rhizopus arrhizus]|nr:hypothetical protein G6F63_015853 [Rhizopus arrhizus]
MRAGSHDDVRTSVQAGEFFRMQSHLQRKRRHVQQSAGAVTLVGAGRHEFVGHAGDVAGASGLRRVQQMMERRGKYRRPGARLPPLPGKIIGPAVSAHARTARVGVYVPDVGLAASGVLSQG